MPPASYALVLEEQVNARGMPPLNLSTLKFRTEYHNEKSERKGNASLERALELDYHSSTSTLKFAHSRDNCKPIRAVQA